jgi:flagellar basal-body rod protein FlgG
MIRSLHTAASGMEAQQLNIDVIANNLANVNTTGFKKSRAEFQDVFYQEIRAATQPTEGTNQGSPVPLEVGQGVQPIGTQRMFQTGDMVNTQNPLDMAIEGTGFFRIALPDGRHAYTRAGAFKSDANGQLVTTDGRSLDPPVFIPPETVSLTVERDGTVKALQPGDTAPIEIGRMELSQFVNPAGLKAAGQGLYLETEASGVPIDGLPDEDGFGRIAQGMLESSNVQVVEEMIDLIEAQRAYEINSRVVAAADQMLQTTNQLK